jgi:hypothetical protein
MAALYGTAGDPSAQDPACDGVAVTPSDTVDLSTVSTYLWIGGAGSGGLVVTMVNGTKLTFAGVGVGMLPLRVSRVWSTGTTVTAIVALWRGTN